MISIGKAGPGRYCDEPEKGGNAVLQKLDGYKKLTITVLSFVLILANTYVGKQLDIDITGLVDAIFGLIVIVYNIAQAIHDIQKEKTR